MNNLLSRATIEANLSLMRDTIDQFQNIEAPDMIMQYLGEITSLQATAIETQASAKYWLLEASNQELDRQAGAMKDHKIPPSIAKLRADSMVREWHFLYEMSERCSRSISHTIDAVRTKISYMKEARYNSKEQI